ncbi:unnamed protein product [Euphydryas editha]|uniref:Mos1 transposase HTH domain-containing protein n=1 Tax=Euphydryas editha TaxID=104508 RepID=A0AAU9VDC2_EUPED|nr:unnamed protein product [Euphydryas editha]
MEYPEDKNQHFRHLLFFDFYRGQKADETAWEICNVHGKCIIGKSAQKWFAKFKNENFYVDDTHRSGNF